MTYVVGSITFGPAPCKIIEFPKPPINDGGKSRIHRKRDNFKFRIPEEPIVDCADDLVMDHADNGMPSDSPYHAPDADPA
jgi:hypothetical protein